MNLHCTVWIWAGGEGSGCHGPNCGRPKGRLEPVEDLRKGDAYQIRDENGKVIGSILVHRYRDMLKVDWVGGILDAHSGEFSPIGVGVLRSIVKELKEKYPGVEVVGGKRITGVHPRTGTQETKVAWE